MLYHASALPGLHTLLPHPSTHQTAWVYALSSPAAALLFGAPHDDFDLLIDVEADTAQVWECWPGAFTAAFRGKSCSLYQVAEDGFLSGQTGWAPEWVSAQAVSVVQETPVPDLYTALQDEQAAGRLYLHLWEDSSDYKGLISRHILDRLIRCDILDGPVSPRLQQHFGLLIDGLRELQSGKYL